MAQQENQLHQVQFCCSICLDLFKDPVTIPCGHNYCMNCIKDFWNGDEQKKIPSCPQCRQTFTPRPVLVKNTMLAALVEQLKKTGLQAAPADHCYAGPEDVGCDVCSGRKLKAIKSCLACLVSYCDKHLQPHYDVAPLRKHQLVEPSKNLQDNICSHHDEVMKMFCRTDQTCICYLCSVDEHKGHDTVSAATERTERQRELEVKLQKIPEIIQKKEEEVKFYQKEVETICHSADEAVEACEKIFTELICLIQKRSSDVKKHIRSNQKIRVSQAETRQKKLQKDITELKRKEAELKCLSCTEDHIHFLQKYSPPPLFSFPFLFFEHPKPFDAQYLEDVNAAASEAVCTVQEILDDSKLKISLKEAEVDNLPSTHPAEPKKREEFLQYSKKISLDSNSANKHLSLHEQKVIKTEKEQRYVENSERFDSCCQVLSRGSLTGRSYWEVEMTGRCTAAVSYAGICRKGPFSDCRFGLEDSSWALERCQLMYSFRHNNTLTIISGPRSSRVGVYLDHQAGVLSFYSVSETMTLLHRVQTTFSQPLYAGLGLYKTGDQAEFCTPK